MKIYTKTGDSGKTSLIGGSRVPKHHIRIEAYGTIDELNSYLGLIRDQDIKECYKKTLLRIQHTLFTIDTELACDPDSKDNKYVLSTKVKDSEITFLENEIDSMNAKLSQLNKFIVPGGNPIVSYCHIARTICRRAERIVTKLAENGSVNSNNIKYINRLSDYLFILSRKISKDLKIKEIFFN